MVVGFCFEWVLRLFCCLDLDLFVCFVLVGCSVVVLGAFRLRGLVFAVFVCWVLVVWFVGVFVCVWVCCLGTLVCGFDGLV